MHIKHRGAEGGAMRAPRKPVRTIRLEDAVAKAAEGVCLAIYAARALADAARDAADWFRVAAGKVDCGRSPRR